MCVCVCAVIGTSCIALRLPELTSNGHRLKGIHQILLLSNLCLMMITFYPGKPQVPINLANATEFLSKLP